MASASRRLYVGVTGQLTRRIDQHRRLEIKGFTRKYQMVRLVYVEATSGVPERDQAGEADQRLGEKQEDQLDRGFKSGVARSCRRLTWSVSF
jgi:predicted GIY-YIG superfamily endonuclease